MNLATLICVTNRAAFDGQVAVLSDWPDESQNTFAVTLGNRCPLAQTNPHPRNIRYDKGHRMTPPREECIIAELCIRHHPGHYRHQPNVHAGLALIFECNPDDALVASDALARTSVSPARSLSRWPMHDHYRQQRDVADPSEGYRFHRSSLGTAAPSGRKEPSCPSAEPSSRPPSSP